MNIRPELRKEIITSLHKNGVETELLKIVLKNMKQGVYENDIESDGFYMEFQTVNINNKRVWMFEVCLDEEEGSLYNISLDGRNLFLDDWHHFINVYYKFFSVNDCNSDSFMLYNEMGQPILPFAIDGIHMDAVNDTQYDGLVCLVKYGDDKRPRYNLLNADGQLISEEWFLSAFYNVDNFSTGLLAYFIENQDGLWNILKDAHGNFLFSNWYEYVNFSSFEKYPWIVGKNGHYNIMDDNENCISKNWFDYKPEIWYDCVIVSIRDKYNLLKSDGTYFSDVWFDKRPQSKHGRSGSDLTVCINKKYNIVICDFDNIHYLNNIWVDGYIQYSGSFWLLKNNEQYNILDYSGKKMLLKKWYERCCNNNTNYVFWNGPSFAESLDKAVVYRDKIVVVDGENTTEYNIKDLQ